MGNKGSTLILIIVSIAFISILCTILLSMTVCNVQMKDTNQKAKANFYNAEAVYNQVKSAVEEAAAQALKTAYEEAMETYLDKSVSFTDLFLDNLAEALGGTSNSGTYSIDMLNKYVNNLSYFDIPAGSNILIKDTSNKAASKIILKNVRISFTDSNHFKSTICSDIVIKTPELNFDSIPNYPPVFSSYGLIADNKISLNANQVNILGDIYAGDGGIELANSSHLTVTEEKNIVTRGDISVLGSSNLSIHNNPSVWAKNIATRKGTGVEEDTVNPTVIRIDGKCYVADDLMLEAKNSKVTITGEYYGYGKNTSHTAEENSAVILNGKNSSLDFTSANKLLIAGRAYLNTSSISQIETGESLAVKGIQYAYLVPDEYIWCRTNPVTYDRYINNTTGIEVDLNKASADPSGINVKDYTTEWTKVFYQAGPLDSDKLIYYYLKFPSEDAANRYLQKYYEKFNNDSAGKIVDARIDPYADNIQLKSPTNSIISTGNLFSFESSPGKSSLIPNSINPSDSSSALLDGIVENLTSRYNRIVRTLSDISSAMPKNPDSLFKSIINSELITKDNSSGNGFIHNIKTVSIGENTVYLVDNASDSVPCNISELPGHSSKGIIIATGSVKADEDFTGLILSGDTVFFRDGVTVTSSDSIAEAVILANNPDVNRYFWEYAASTLPIIIPGNSNNTIDVSELIGYENWTKNEE